MGVFTYRMPAGIPGAVMRVEQATIVPEQSDAANPFPRYGMFGKIVAGLFRPVASGDAATVVVGLLTRPYVTNSTTNGLGTSTPPTGTVALDRLARGFMTVLLALGTAAKMGQVYVVTTAGGSVLVGDIVTSASPAGGGTAVAVVGAFFVGPADSSGNVEIQYNI